MLRFVAISYSLMLLFSTVVGNTAKAAQKITNHRDNQTEKRTSSKQKGESSNSSENDKHPESSEEAFHIDFSSALSLVNVQLQWREEIKKEEDRQRMEDEVSESPRYFGERDSQHSTMDTDNFVGKQEWEGSFALKKFGDVPIRCHSVSVCFNQQRNRQLAYVLNCGTYPLLKTMHPLELL